MALSESLPQINLGVQGETQGGLHSDAQRVNPEFRVASNFRIIPEQYFSRVENVVEFLENIDNNLTYYEIPKQLACAYLKGHLTGRALDWFEDTGGEKYFISEEVYRKYFSYRLRQKTKDRVVTAQGAPCCHLGRVELQIRIREFQKTSEFRILNNIQYQCILGIDFMKESKLTLDFDQKSLIIPHNQIKQLKKMEKPVEIDLSDTKLGEGQTQKLRNLFNGFKGLFSDQPGLTHVLYHGIDTGDKGPLVSRPYRYDRIKQGIIDYHIEKMLQEGRFRPIQPPYASPVVLTRKNNDLPPDSPEAYRFAIYYRKLNAITKYPRYPLPGIDDLITKIPHTDVMSTLDLKSGYFQLGISPKDIEKTAFITRNGTFAFLRMPFGLSEGAPNFQKAIDIILKPVIGRSVSVYMDDVIITHLHRLM
ncbi:retrovirus-related Pol polyprotein from transposon 297 [Trichonephila clavipes]|nr:retrovirus-related Pol polyprotein from transposon 297 [Trichonephila clavipes]